jgi:hypothetical protein
MNKRFEKKNTKDSRSAIKMSEFFSAVIQVDDDEEESIGNDDFRGKR